MRLTDLLLKRHRELRFQREREHPYEYEAEHRAEVGEHSEIILGVRIDFRPEPYVGAVPVRVHPLEEWLEKALNRAAWVYDFATDSDWQKFNRVLAEAYAIFRKERGEGEVPTAQEMTALRKAFEHGLTLLRPIADEIARLREAR